MRLYLLLIAVAIFGIAGVVSPVMSLDFFSVLAATTFAAFTVILMDGLTATICRLLPKKCANHKLKIYQVSAKEKKFYEKLKIRKWKDKVPEIGQFTGFRKNKIVDPKSLEYLERFLLEICYGEIGHSVSCATGFLILLLYPIYPYWLHVAIPVAIVSVLFNIPSFIILRYNSYKLRVLWKTTVKRLEREQAAKEVAVAQYN